MVLFFRLCMNGLCFRVCMDGLLFQSVNVFQSVNEWSCFSDCA